MRKVTILAVDVSWVALSSFLAVLIRDNFVIYPAKLEQIAPYAAIAVVASALVFIAARLNNTLWQYTSLSDVLRIMGAVTVALLLALFMSFALNRLEGVARSVPVIQWLLLVGGIVGSRVAFRVWHEQAGRRPSSNQSTSVQYTLIVGVSHLTELYLEAVAEYASNSVHIVGLLSERRDFHGRLLRRQRVLGTPEDLSQVLVQLEVHGITVNRILVMQQFEDLSIPAREGLLAIERSASVRVVWLVEHLGLTDGRPLPEGQAHQSLDSIQIRPEERRLPLLDKYHYTKRIADIVFALLLSAALAPVILVTALIVALDVGLPLVFWQQRPGRFGRSFKLYKFRTMRAAHDTLGNRRSDEQRSSALGRFVRRTKLDELPQFYNVLIGEMSLVGPRPLLTQDQPKDSDSRLVMRPGITGFAQINGGPDISAEDKNALDLWYIENVSLWLDISILLRTAVVLIAGERTDENVLRAARQGLTRPRTQETAGSEQPVKAKAEVNELVATVGPVS